ncbi:MAG TPA: hypothetical protein PLO50_02070 [Nitrospira sp.]|nr:hypothetical protein [Nitrospira sp.]
MMSRVLFSRLFRRRNGSSAPLRHADGRSALSGRDVTFLVSGNTITASPVPLPIATRLFGGGVKSIDVARRRRPIVS